MSSCSFTRSQNNTARRLPPSTTAAASMGQASSSSSVLIYPFNAQSQQQQNIPFSEWITLFTVSLAPLIAHIAAGTPHPSILSSQYCQRPSWHDSMCLYNPTSILWRYAAIADRRIRARDWGVADMAASNALFWTGTPVRCANDADEAGMAYGHVDHVTPGRKEPSRRRQSTTTVGGWNGTEAMITASIPYCTALPLHAHAELLSWETVKTAIITLQGVQALYVLAGGLGRNVEGTNTGLQDAVDNAFFPFTLIGLFRLTAAYWLTSSGFGYAARDEVWMELAASRVARGSREQVALAGEYCGEPRSYAGSDGMRRGYTYSGLTGPLHDEEKYDSPDTTGRQQQTPPDHDPLSPGPTAPSRFRPTSYIPSILFRTTYLLFMLAVWALALLKGTPLVGNTFRRSVSTLLSGSFYIFFMTVSCGVYVYYSLIPARHTGLGGSGDGAGIRSTVIPCMGRLWYKCYTVVVFAWMAAMFVVACCETVRMPCGRYTSLGKEFWVGRTNCGMR
ncbi:uncharacterized protein B0I36DRAFT_340135 [Microdochium trichocladiopsis]|uniref:Uncharacterized protein n=1 Tax=Microdochium trichocladiopsis TaxID=1682393 RepID=A0A9P8XUI3_9PEZI|nr:uncharacterized protein B0I36DRAFT_340135 [Microdochium trichocladiopsis]KAH7012695.1 hypothetical protein B0I36DRAFT_340135 [Microdochium trichocladiopsis]